MSRNLSKNLFFTPYRRFASFSFSPESHLPRAFGIRDWYASRQKRQEASLDPLLAKIRRREAVRVTVTGAAGAIGYALLFRLANGELLGKDQPIILHCLELPQALNALKGVAMELEDSAMPLLEDIIITDDPAKAFDGCDIGLLVGSKPRGPGMERGDLLKENGVIFQKLGKVINEKAQRYARFTVVGNPCNTNCLILANNAPDIPLKNFSAMTRLDHDRSVGFLTQKTILPSNEVNYFAIWGNHSATMFPDLKHTTIHGVPWSELIGYKRADRYYRNEFIPKVQQRGAHIINVRGSSSAASAANACLAHTRDWVLGTPKKDWQSMAVISNGEYGVPPGLVFSYPVWCQNGTYSIVSYPTSFDEFQQYHIEQNISELQSERDVVSSFLPN